MFLRGPLLGRDARIRGRWATVLGGTLEVQVVLDLRLVEGPEYMAKLGVSIGYAWTFQGSAFGLVMVSLFRSLGVSKNEGT